MKHIDLSSFKVIYEYVPSPDAEERLNQAYYMLFDKIEKLLIEEKLNKENSQISP